MSPRWEFETLGQLCKTGAGGTPLKSVKEYYANGDVPWLLSGEVHQGEVNQAKNFITQKGLENSSAKLFPPNTLLIAMYGATAGAVGILRFQASTNQAICGVLPSEKFIPEFLYYYFTHKKDELVAQAAGNAQPNISQEKIRNTCVPVATLDEQRRIVTFLDEAFADIATAKANAEKNLQNARDFFAGQLQDVFDAGIDNWNSSTLGQVYDVRDGTHDSPKYHDEGFPLITSKNLKNEGLTFDDVKLISLEDYNKINERSAVHQGDVLLAMIGTIGNPTVVETIPNFAIKNVALLKVPENQNSYFLRYYLSCPSVITKMQAEAKGTTQKFVGLGYL